MFFSSPFFLLNVRFSLHKLNLTDTKQGYKGKIIPVNPKADEIFGLKCYKEVSRYRRGIDLSVITVPTEHVKNAVIASVEAGVGAIVVITAGFKEVDEAGAAMENEIVDINTFNIEKDESVFLPSLP